MAMFLNFLSTTNKSGCWGGTVPGHVACRRGNMCMFLTGFRHDGILVCVRYTLYIYILSEAEISEKTQCVL